MNARLEPSANNPQDVNSTKYHINKGSMRIRGEDLGLYSAPPGSYQRRLSVDSTLEVPLAGGVTPNPTDNRRFLSYFGLSKKGFEESLAALPQRPSAFFARWKVKMGQLVRLAMVQECPRVFYVISQSFVLEQISLDAAYQKLTF